MTVVGRSKLDHPALGTTGGSALHSSIETMWTAVSDHLGSRFKSYSSQSNSTTVTYEHNFGKDLSTLQVHIYTGSAGNLTKVKDPTAAGWVIAATSGFLKTKVDVTTPSTGGPHTFVVSVHEDEKSLDNLSITGTAGQGYVDVTTQSSAPSSPASGDVRIYSKTDGKLYKKDSSGNEAAVGAGSGSGGVNYLVDWYDATKAVGTVSTVAVGGNVTVSGSFPAVTSAWYADSTSGSAAIASSSDNTLRSTANYLTALSGVSTSGATFVQSPVFNIDGKDLGTALTVQFDVSGNTTDNDWDVVAVRYNSSGVYQELIPIAGNVSTMTGTPSAKLPLGVKQFNGFFITGSTASDVYAIRWRRRAGSAQIRLDSLTVGPNQVLQGAIVTDWQDYTPALTSTSGSVVLGTGGVAKAKWRRVGDAMQIQYTWLWGSTGNTFGTGTYLFELPSGYTIDTTKIPDISTTSMQGSGYYYKATGQYYPLAFSYSNSTKVYGIVTNSAGANLSYNTPATVANSDRFLADFMVPISQWSANTQQAARAVEEYAFNTNTSTTASDTTSFGYGPQGVQGVAITVGLSKRVRFQTPILPTDLLVFEYRKTTGTSWQPIIGVDNATDISSFTIQNAVSYGVKIQSVASSSTDIDVSFGTYAWNNSTYGAVGIPWPTTYYWRVKKVSSGAAVGYPVGARNVIGDTTGTAVPAGYIGESVTANLSAAVSAATTAGNYTDFTGASLSLTTGLWLINVSAKMRLSALSGSPDMRIAIRDGANNVIFSREYAESAVLNTDYNVGLSVPLVVTATTTYKLSSFQEGGTSATTNIGSGGGNTYFNAIRIA